MDGWVTLWDGRVVSCLWVRGIPAWRYGWAPSGLATRRQLRAQGLCPGGHEPFGLLIWRGGHRWAWLYRVDLAKPKRVPSPAQREALERAMAARRWCPVCRRDVGYCISRAYSMCGDCFVATAA